MAFALACAFASVAHAQSKDVAGKFDYYLLALSWSPSFCAVPGMAAKEPRQCGVERRYGFIVHGLWPQYERGWPRACATTQGKDLPPALVNAQLDMMPSPKLVEHEWDAHGTCAGLSQKGYFDLTRQLRTKVAIPAAYAALDKTVMASPAEVRAAFVKANPGLKPDGLQITCDKTRLREVRICFTKAGAFRSCSMSAKDKCDLARAAMPPVRPAAAAILR